MSTMESDIVKTYSAIKAAPEMFEVAKTDPVNHPQHYTSHPSGVECIDVVEHMPYNIGAAIKYLWRAGIKSEDMGQEYDKAIWYIQREKKRLGL